MLFVFEGMRRVTSPFSLPRRWVQCQSQSRGLKVGSTLSVCAPGSNGSGYDSTSAAAVSFRCASSDVLIASKKRPRSDGLLRGTSSAAPRSVFSHFSSLAVPSRPFSSDAGAASQDAQNEESHEEPAFGEKDIIKLRLPVEDAGGHHVQLREWYKGEGDEVEAGEAVCEIETAAFMYDYQSPFAGYVAKILTPESDEYLEQGRTIALMAEEKDEIAKVVAYWDSCKEAKQNEKQKKDDTEEHERESEGERIDEDTEDDEITAFLRQLPDDMSVYAAALKSDGFDSIATLRTATREDLEELGIKKGHRRIILGAVAPNDDAA